MNLSGRIFVIGNITNAFFVKENIVLWPQISKISTAGLLFEKASMVRKVVVSDFNQTDQNFADFTKIPENYRIGTFFCTRILRVEFYAYLA